jgi:uncharacterized protein YcsI (UPF0317 family)
MALTLAFGSHPALDSGSAVGLRAVIRAGRWSGVTSGAAPDAVHANLVVLPAEAADEFRNFCLENSKACPLLDMTAPGDPRPLRAAPDADLRTDLPRYRVFRSGALIKEPESLTPYWRDDLVAFLLGCSFTFESALVRAGIPMRHHETGSNVAMYRTRIPCTPIGRFHGELVVSMRPVHRDKIDEVSTICAQFSAAHGSPVAVGLDPELGIDDLGTPDFGDPVEVRPDELPVFWACGVTAEVAAAGAGLDLVITHAPGHMFVTDWQAPGPGLAALGTEGTSSDR